MKPKSSEGNRRDGENVKRRVLTGVALIAASTLFGCLNNTLNLGELAQMRGYESAISVAEAIAGNGDVPPDKVQVVETDVEVYGYVSALAELFCPCFELNSDEASITVKYGLFPEEEEYYDVSVEGIDNGDWVLVVGTLRTTGQLQPEIWAREILLAQEATW